MLPAALLFVTIGALVSLRGCHGDRRLVEVFDNGPVGGPPGGSQGYRWVGVHDNPPPGNGWKTVDYNTLTPQQRARIR